MLANLFDQGQAQQNVGPGLDPIAQSLVHCIRFCYKVFSEGSKFDNVFFADKGIEDINSAINGSSSARQRNAIEIAFRWRADAGPTLIAGLVAV